LVQPIAAPDRPLLAARWPPPGRRHVHRLQQLGNAKGLGKEGDGTNPQRSACLREAALAAHQYYLHRANIAER
jgi:hypothetical protein